MLIIVYGDYRCPFVTYSGKKLSALTGPDSTINNHSFSVDVDAIYHKQRITAALL